MKPKKSGSPRISHKKADASSPAPVGDWEKEFGSSNKAVECSPASSSGLEKRFNKFASYFHHPAHYTEVQSFCRQLSQEARREVAKEILEMIDTLWPPTSKERSWVRAPEIDEFCGKIKSQFLKDEK